MSIELARRLLGSGAPAAAVEAALMAEVSDGVPFVEALIERFPALGPLVERELERAPVAEGRSVSPLLDLARGLPDGMCERLLAVPIRKDPASGCVEVAAVDVLGPHVAAEFSFHLGAEVRVVRARRSEVSAALLVLREGAIDAASPERFSTQPPKDAPDDPPRLPSDSPIPLVRRPSPLHERGQSKPSEAGSAVPRSMLVAPAFAFETSLEDSLAELLRAESAEQIGRVICRALEPADVILLAVRSKGFEARMVSRSLASGNALNLSLAVETNAIFAAALRTGFYLGPLSPGLNDSELRSLLSSEACSEVYSAPVLVAGRPVLVLLLARFGPSLDATRRADKLLSAAGPAIERVLLAKKLGR